MKNLLLLCIALFLSTTVFADKNRKASPIFSGDECTYLAPPGIDIDEDCDLITEQSGKAVYFCPEELIITCVED